MEKKAIPEQANLNTETVIGEYRFQESLWLENCDAIKELRHKVFVLELHLGMELVCDNEETASRHLLVWHQSGRLAACGRLTPNGRIGRIAVSMRHRGQGLGTLVLRQLIELAKKSGIKQLSLNAEMDHQGFYLRQQFTPDGPVFMKQGVPHQGLKRNVNQTTQ